jgi:hypothetical protein
MAAMGEKKMASYKMDWLRKDPNMVKRATSVLPIDTEDIDEKLDKRFGKVEVDIDIDGCDMEELLDG